MSKPNIVVIMCDDLDDLSAQIMVSGFFPNITQRIVTTGVRFQNSFATTPLCGPSRATYLTGKYSHNHGVRNNTPPNGGITLFNDTDTLATKLQAGGYHTCHVGKYLNGYGEPPVSPYYVPPGWTDWHGLIDPTTYSVFDYSINHNGTRVEYGHAPEDYQTGVLGTIAANAVTDGLASANPLFLSVTPLAPHIESATIIASFADGVQEWDKWRWWARPDARDQTGPKAALWNYIVNILPNYSAINPNAFNEADVSDKPAFMQHPIMTMGDKSWAQFQFETRLLCLLPVDDIVGKIATALGPTELANTAWVFTSDNGFVIGSHRKAQKIVAYEESIRVPLYIASPGCAPHLEPAIVLNNDLAPTILEFAQEAPDINMDGRSLVPLLMAVGAPWTRKRFLIEHVQHETPPTLTDVPTYSALRCGPTDTYTQRKLVRFIGGEVEYYVLPDDPNELVSKHADPTRLAEIVDLSLRLETLKTASGLGCYLGEN